MRHSIDLSEEEFIDINQIIDKIVTEYPSSEDERFFQDASLYAHQLPMRLRKFMNEFRLNEVAGYCVISGYQVNDTLIGDTPRHWKEKSLPSPTVKEEIFSVLMASLLGEPFGWNTQQDGNIIHNILPIKEHEFEQMGSGSKGLLWWHTEEAFHPYRPDYLGLMCLRNPNEVATTIASVDTLKLNQQQIDILFEPRFVIRPDESHFQKNNHIEEVEVFETIEEFNNNPDRVAILFGDKKSPYIRIDPFFMECSKEDIQAQQALDLLCSQINEQITDVKLKPGDICFIDNYRAVHGRKPFFANYDGKDRWLKRVNITRDLRKSRDMRSELLARKI